MTDDNQEHEPEYVDDEGRAKVPLAYRVIRDRDQRVRVLVETMFRDSRHKGSRR